MAERTSGSSASGKDVKNLLNLKISKRAYIFTIKRPFEHVRQFKVEKRLEGLEQFKRLASASLKDFLKSSQSLRKPSSKAQPIRVFPKSPAIGKTLFLLIAIILVFIIGIAVYFAFLLNTVPRIMPPSEPSGSRLSLSSDYSDLVSYGPSGDAVGLAAVRLDSENITRADISFLLYSQPVVRRVVLVDLGGPQDTFTTEFASNMSALLKADGGNLETMHIDQLMHMPPSAAVYLLPSEYIPASIIGQGLEPERDLIDLTKKGGVLIFAGFPFTDALGKNGDIIKISPDHLKGAYGLSFPGSAGVPFSDELGITLKMPPYDASGSNSFKIYGAVVVASFGPWNSTGELVFIPQTLKKGWNESASAAAQSFFKIIRHVSWNVPIAKGNAYFSPPKASESFSLVTAHSAELSKSAPYPYLLAEVVDTSNRTYMRSTVRPQISSSMVPQGKLSHSPVALPTPLTGKLLPMIGENLATTYVPMELTAYYNNNPVSRVAIGTQSKRLQYDYAVNLAPGDYVLVLSDTSGIVYAKSYLRVPLLSLVPDFYSWDAGRFSFALLQDGQQLAPETTVSGIKATMDNSLPVTLTSEKGKIIYQSPSAPVSAGTHTFTFDFGTNTQTITETFTPPRNWWDETQYRLAALAVGCIFLLGYALRRPDIELYGLDVPDFPPLSKLAISVKREVVLSIFDSMNKEYKWNYMPLKVSEIKSGFRKIMHQGKGILIGDYNTERILDMMLHEGYMKKMLGLYVPSSWESESNRNIRYLAIFRSMRDVLVNSAIRFTDLNQSNDYDSLIGIGEEGTMVQIYEQSAIGRILMGAQEHPQLLLFANDAEKVKFEDSLDSTSQPRIMLKMLVSSGRLSLVTVDELESYIKKAAPR